ncbi:MAG: GAF domain-containing protein [Sphingomonadales bacterium]
MNSQSKAEIYRRVEKEILSVLEGETNLTAKMASVTCLLSDVFDQYFWTGFYLVDPEKEDELVVGPYQGTLGCLRIPFGRGVCGVAASTKKTQVVEDVHSFSSHIACDVNTNSEIVVPVFNADGELIAVFDVDSTQHDSFNETDKVHLEAIMEKVFSS